MKNKKENELFKKKDEIEKENYETAYIVKDRSMMSYSTSDEMDNINKEQDINIAKSTSTHSLN
jgi:hypothetical protein